MSDALLGSELDAIVNRYLEELADALRRLPASQRDHLVSEIREHIVEMRSERPVRDRSDMEALLNRVGLPEDIAAVALEGEEEADVPVAIPSAVAPSEPKNFGGRVSKRMVLGGAVAAAVVVFGLFVGFAVGHHQGADVFGIVQRGSSAQPVIVKPSLPPLVAESVPNVIGDSQAEAAAALSAAGLSYAVENSSSSSVPAGQVISQNPPSGYAIPRRIEVIIVVSSGPPSTTS